MNEISTLITQLGFPIVCCIGMYLYIDRKDKANREDTIKREERMFEEIKYTREVNVKVLETNKTLANDINNKLDKLINQKEVK